MLIYCVYISFSLYIINTVCIYIYSGCIGARKGSKISFANWDVHTSIFMKTQ